MSNISLADRRYRVDDQFPPPGVFVRLNWAGWEGVGVRGWLKRKGRLVEFWREVLPGGRDGGELLPAGAVDRKGQIVEGLERPALWWPTEPVKWKGPLPEPVALVEPQQWSSRQKFGAVDDAESAELAREMEADRAAARAHGRRDDGGDRGAKRLQWWRDASQITYSPEGKIGKREAEGRIMRALAPGVLDKAAVGLGFSTLASQQSSTPNEHDEIIVRMQQTPRDLQDELKALGWFRDLLSESRTHALVLALAADQRALSWRSIAREVDLSQPGTQTAYATALVVICAIANGLTTAGVIARENALAELRSRNRAHKGGAAW